MKSLGLALIFDSSKGVQRVPRGIMVNPKLIYQALLTLIDATRKQTDWHHASQVRCVLMVRNPCVDQHWKSSPTTSLVSAWTFLCILCQRRSPRRQAHHYNRHRYGALSNTTTPRKAVHPTQSLLEIPDIDHCVLVDLR
jgi:hypothetical protein